MDFGGYKYEISEMLKERDGSLLNHFFAGKYLPFAKATKRRSDLDEYTFRKHLQEPFGDRELCSITSEEIDGWKLHQIDQGYKPATINKHSSLFRRILNLAKQWHYIERNPFDNVVVKELDTGEYVQRFLSEEEIYRLLSAAKRSKHPYILHLIRLLILTGARKSEWRLARWCDVNFLNQELFVPISKSGRSRKVILSKDAIKVIGEVRISAKSLGLTTDHRDWIITNPRTKKPYTCFHHAFDRVRIDADLPNVRIHDLRHTFASLLVNNGATIYEVQKLLGHHHISMTERYAHLFPNTLADRVEIIAQSIKFAD